MLDPLMEVTPAVRTNRVFGLDCLRALAIGGVLFAHAFGFLYPQMPAWFGLLGHGGFYGVELFFVLSGFLIGRILIRHGAQLGTGETVAVFYIRRWFRTLPLFWLFLLLNVLLETQTKNHQLSLGEILEHGFFLRTLTAYHPVFFPESWSLGIEEWFYLLFPAAVWLGLRAERHFVRVFLTVAAAFYLFSTIGRMLSAHSAEASWAQWQRVIVIYRFDGLMTGVFAAWISLRWPAFWQARSRLLAIIGSALLVGLYVSLWRWNNGAFVFGPDDYFARTFRFNLVSLGFAFLLPWASLWKIERENFPSLAVRKIALWSYALYLVHLPLFQLLMHFGYQDWHDSLIHALILFTCMIAGSILVSALLFRSYERPWTKLREKAAPVVSRIFRSTPQSSSPG
ncbi:MAG: acyltransferase family protein [Chthoniobacterales bacterium]